VPIIAAEISTSGRDIVLVAGGDLHELAASAKRLELLTPLFSVSDPPGALTCPLTWAAAVQLRQTYGADLVVHPRLQAWIDAEAITRTAPLGETLTGYTPPEGFVPRPYQVAGALEIARTGRALIFDEPRTGKTITTILGLLERGAATGQSGPVIVVCPASVVDPWVAAWSNWAPHVRVAAWRGPKRKELAGTADVYVTSYDTARIDTPKLESRRKGSHPLLSLGAEYLVVDECHMVKNPTTARTKSVTRLADGVAGFVALSGTPITHHPADLHPMLEVLAPGAFPARGRWIKRYCLVVDGDYNQDILGLHPSTEPEFRVTILGQHRRVARADVMSDLPPKVYSVRTVDVPAEWRKVYDDFESRMLAELPDGTELKTFDAQTKLTHLSTLASAAADVRYELGPDVDETTGQPKEHVHLDLKTPSWKVDVLMEILDERCGENGADQVVAFAPSRQLAMIAGAAAEKAGYRVGYIVGKQAAGKRTATRLAFQAGELDVICATTGAGGEGITLSAAGTVVYLQRPWALVKSVQSEDRAEGYNEDGTVPERGTEVIDIVARNTIDSRVRGVLRTRAGALAELLQDPRILSELLGGRDTKDTDERKAS
jgi:SNF2 family DNA or RNA helicase